MKPNKKIIDLIESGFSFKTLNKLSEKQLTELHSRVVKEQTLPTGSTGKGSISFRTKPSDDVVKKYVNLGMNVTLPEGEMTEKSKNKKNPWAICTASLSDEFGTSERSEWTKSQMKKYERCVKGVKEKMDEGKNPFESILESKISQIIEKHVHPKMSKKDFLDTISKQMIEENKTTTKPTTKPDTKPTTKPKTPFSPKPGPNPRPKAKKDEVGEGTTTKPTTKPGTKPTTKPKTPFSPKPGPNPKPKAKGNIPNWFTYDKLGLKIK